MTTQTIVNNVTTSDASWANDVDSTAYSVLTGVAGTNTITATGPANYTYVAARTPVWFIPAVTNTGATTINITPSGGAAGGAKNIFSGGAACVGGELPAGVPVGIVYDGTQYNTIGRAKRFTSAAQAITAAGSLTIAHGLGAKPTLIYGYIKCTTIDQGYAVGDELVIGLVQQSTATANDRGISVVPDATNLNVRFGSDANTFNIVNKGSGATNSITNASWQLYLSAWVI